MDKALVLVAVGAPLVQAGAGVTPSVNVQQGHNCLAAQVKFSGVAVATRFWVEISRDGGTEWKKIGISAQFKAAAAAGGEPARKTAIAALGLDYKENFDVVPDSAAGFVVIPFDITQGKNLVRIANEAACTIDHAEIVNYVN